MSGELNYAAGITQDAITNAQKEIALYEKINKDGYIARSILAERPLRNPNLRKDIVRKVDKVGGEDIITAGISAGGTIPDLVGTAKKDVIHQIYWISDAVMINEAALAVDPSAWNTDIRVAMMECQRRENYTVINGVSTLGITGVVGAAQANTRGAVTAAGSTGIYVGNCGAWDGSETDKLMDPYEDLRVATGMIDPQFPRSSLKLLGRPLSLGYLLQKDEFRNPYSDQIGKLFGVANGSIDFMVTCDYVPAGYVYVCAQNMNAAELVMAQDYNIDANYPREKGQNRYAEVGGWMGFEFHNYGGFVQVQIT